MSKTKIFVDGSCYVCDFEISHYRRMAPELFEIVDISDPAFNAAQFGLTKDAVNHSMHVMSPQGEVQVGVAAFQQIWSQLDQYRWAAKVIGLPVVNPLARMGYRLFASVRPWLPKRHRTSR